MPEGTCAGVNGECPWPVAKRGLCQAHYRRSLKGADLTTPIRAWVRKGEAGSAGPAMVTLPCSGCGTPVTRYRSQLQGGKAYCSRACHFTNDRPDKPRTGMTVSCARAGCDEQVYLPQYKIGDGQTRYHSKGCRDLAQQRRVEWSCERCGKRMVTRPSEVRQACSEACWRRLRFLDTSFRLTDQGYVLAFVARDGTTVMEHRLVMEGLLGRLLLPGEEVHHRNTVRTDNRPGNLELWVVSQPRGGRVEDVVEWSREMLRRYAPEELRDAS